MSFTSAFAFILVMLAAGKLLAWRRLVPDNAAATLNLVVLYVCLPAAVLLYAPRLEFDWALAALVAVPWTLLVAGSLLVLAVARLARFARATTGALLLLVTLGNTSYLGFALIPALAGEGALRYAVAYDQFGSFVMLCTFGLIVLGLYGGERPTLAGVARRIVTFPPFLVLALALTVMPSEYPEPMARPLRLLADSLLPLVALASGMQLGLALPRQHIGPFVFGLAAKLVLMPALALALAALYGLSGDMRAAAIYETAMPPMITAGALLSLAGIEAELAAALVGYGIVASMITLPLWHWVLGG
ncbi:AEC family transporter [Dokdonella sp.]|uniref:AEC family transporter n=1 Tax=Dokdonella sp. TaxID=2291710 RepID=UPI0031BF3371|nr:AEC family transporter [Dokdonella sp.]